MKVEARDCRIYKCAKGEGLPMHVHPAGVGHLCVIALGRAEIVVGEKRFERGVGVYNLPPDVQHSIKALEDGTVFYNVF